MKVPFFSVSATVHAGRTKLRQAIAAIDTTALVDGPMVAALERRIATVTGAGHCLAVGSGTDALAIMLKAAGIGPGDEVIVPAYTFFATASTVVHVGATPVLVDVQPDTYAIDVVAVEAAITPRSRAIMAVHLFAQMADVVALRDLADRHGLVMLEDSAEAIGMRHQGRHAGRWGRAGVLSFFPTKTLGAFGDAGMILTDDSDLATAARELKSGRSDGGAWRSGSDEVAAAILLFRLDSLEAEIETRAHLAGRYDTLLAGVSGVKIPRIRADKEQAPPVWYVYLIECDRRDELAAGLADHGIETEAYYPRPLTRQPALAPYSAVAGDVPVAEAASRRALALPLYPDLTEDQVTYVCDRIKEFFDGDLG